MEEIRSERVVDVLGRAERADVHLGGEGIINTSGAWRSVLRALCPPCFISSGFTQTVGISLPYGRDFDLSYYTIEWTGAVATIFGQLLLLVVRLHSTILLSWDRCGYKDCLSISALLFTAPKFVECLVPRFVTTQFVQKLFWRLWHFWLIIKNYFYPCISSSLSVVMPSSIQLSNDWIIIYKTQEC